MNITRITATFGAAFIIAGAPALASGADTQSGPIHVNQLTFSGGYSSAADSDEPTVLPSAANISFTNQNTVTATAVVFALEAQGCVVERFNDVGSFAPGVTINHSFSETEPSDDMLVAVARATFSDGTIWQNPDVPAP